MRVPVAALSLAVPGCLVPAWAQDGGSLVETVVTATRTDTRADILLSDVMVIDAETIERSSGRSLSEVLTRQAGLQMTSNGGLGKQSGLFVRGTETRHVLLLIDGVRFGSATQGSASWDNIPLEMIERIEVLKGPASALYGSDAVGGVVQIFTKRGVTGFQPSAGFSLGSQGYRKIGAGIGGGTPEVLYSLDVTHLHEDGFSSTNPGVSFNRYNPDRDGFDQDSLSASVQWTPAAGWRADARLLHAEGTSRYDGGPGAFDVRSDSKTQVLGAGLTRKWDDDVSTRLSWSTSKDLSTDFGSATKTSAFDTTHTQWGVQSEWRTVLGTWLAGFERLEEEVESTQAYAVNQRSTNSWFVGLNGLAGSHVWQVNLRQDRNSQFGRAGTGLVSYGYQLSQHWRVHGAYGTTFKVPSFNTLYWSSPTFQGNPTTQPERGRNREVGMAYSLGSHEWKMVYYDNRVRGFITLQPAVANVPQARMRGWTLSHSSDLGKWSLRNQLDWLDARNVVNGRRLNRRAEQQLTSSLEYRAGTWTWGSSLLLLSDRYDDAANTVRLPGFATLDLYASRQLSSDWRLDFRLNNLADKPYELAKGYNQPGRALYVGVRWQPRMAR
ncbi:TonB-dependent vitamin B12 receptor [Hydrogenophaga aquatica]